jgi:hypothetical protein
MVSSKFLIDYSILFRIGFLLWESLGSGKEENFCFFKLWDSMRSFALIFGEEGRCENWDDEQSPG